jgi:hydrogenase maturation factor
MNNTLGNNGVGARFISPSSPSIDSSATCELDAEGHCITCSDEALTAVVVRVDEVMGMASVTIEEELDEVDITLLDEVAEGDLLLVHGGVAIANVGKNSVTDEANNAR